MRKKKGFTMKKMMGLLLTILLTLSLFGCTNLPENQDGQKRVNDNQIYYESPDDGGYLGVRQSTPDKLILESGGCCFTAYNVEVFLLDESGNKTVLIFAEEVANHDVYECIKVPDIAAPVQVVIDFTSDWGPKENDYKEDVSLTAGEFDNTGEFLKEGLLLLFHDGQLCVRNGNNEKLFKKDSYKDIL